MRWLDPLTKPILVIKGDIRHRGPIRQANGENNVLSVSSGDLANANYSALNLKEFIRFIDGTHDKVHVVLFSDFDAGLATTTWSADIFHATVISAPLYYFPELWRNASAYGVDVACGSFKPPIFWFATLGALGLFLFCGLLTLLMVYFSWRFIYKGSPRVKEIEVSVDGFSEILDV
ncbi:hypothetical protein SESBI_00223 [Sesbania bispinosa]|nr:hypothetical protein SESBI_00223 [Sesbania bispinosa]